MSRVLIVGDYSYDYYEKSLQNAFESLGYETESLAYVDGIFLDFIKKVLLRYDLPYLCWFFERRILRYLAAKNFSICIVFGGMLISENFFKYISDREGLKMILLNHDNPFTNIAFSFQRLIRSAAEYDFVLTPRMSTYQNFERVGANPVLFPQFAAYERFSFLTLSSNTRNKVFDFGFIGHFENDGRDTKLLSLLEAGHKVLIGINQTWNDSPLLNRLRLYDNCTFVIAPSGMLYSYYLNQCWFALNFNSVLNQDNYTTRCFEIPLCRTVLLTEDNEYVRRLFGNRCLYFDPVNNYIEMPKIDIMNRMTIIEEAFSYVSKEHTNHSRVKQILELCN